ncbi:putative 2og-fe oxygenase family protein [Triangularia verruculosa]|uniref:2og-fe oxygenase family protein n=1 Tax=Triangularia verruculosa TaxID=2587418 RepID=A0AAN7APE6_9PEZI|nr:putative 2og-fe oxygenase family protein [Triangularia verruculosa]
MSYKTRLRSKPDVDPAPIEMEDNTNALLEELKSAMDTSEETFVFACGGLIPIIGPDAKTPDTNVGADLSAVTLRWDPRDPSTASSRCRISFPETLTEQEGSALAALVADMQPATFGLGKKDVYDEEYRKALKLDPTQFSTNFCPYPVGIIDIISKILAPGVGKSTVRAELYKLNVYEGPSGHFKAHVDTPRSKSQFGSLVICLPAEHSGGELEVRHKGKMMTFDWSTKSSKGNAVQWAAFYSDCEHESKLARSLNIQLPLVKHAQKILDDKTFMPKGGYLGFYTSHAYPHTNEDFSVSAIKGIDRAIWHCFLSLGCRVDLRPVLHLEVNDYCDGITENKHVVGKYFPTMTVNDQVWEDGDHKRIIKRWGVSAVKYKQIVWMNEKQDEHKRRQLTYIVYGNEANLSEDYSYCAIIVRVPEIDNESGARASLPARNSESESDCASSFDFTDEEEEMENAMVMEEDPEEESADDDSDYEG